mgnify:CR=1 FL=1
MYTISMLKSILFIALGATTGATLRWWIGLKLNSWFPAIPPGTLVANLVGSFIIGLMIAYFATNAGVSPEWRLLIITGLCGSLTTFSTFSAETLTLLQQGQYLFALGAIALHVCGSITMTFAGLLSWNGIKMLLG